MRYQSFAKFSGSNPVGCQRPIFSIPSWLSFGGVAVALCSGITLPAIAQPSSTGQLAQVLQPARVTNETRLLYVNPNAGDDWHNQGGERSPFKTITKALQVAPANTVIVLTPGTYSAETGESFPLRLKPRVTIQGNTRLQGKDIVIRGGGPFLSPSFASQNITILGVTQGGLAGVTVTNPNPRGYGVWIESASPIILENTFRGNVHDGISMTGSSAPVVRGNVFIENGANGMTIYGTSQPEVRENLFTKTGFGINIAQEARPLIIGNRILQNEDGVVVQAQAKPVLRGNLIEGNARDGLVAIAQAQPDLGRADDLGNNVFDKNGRLDVNAEATNQAIAAVGNQLVSNRTKGRLDLAEAASSVTSQSDAAMPMPEPVSQSVAKAESASLGLPPKAVRSPAALKPQPSPAKPISMLPPTGERSQSPPAKPLSQKLTLSAAAFPVPSVEKSASTGAVPTPTTTPATTLRSQPISAFSFRARPATPTERSPRQEAATAPASIPTSAEAAIAIPVPPPETARVQPQVQAAPTVVAARPLPKPVQQAMPQAIVSAEPSAVEIPVPPPESGSVVPVTPTPIPAVPVPSAPIAALSALGSGLGSSDVLPVPGPDIPVGNGGGSLPTVLVAQNPLDALANFSAPANRPASLGAKYRVVVEVSDESEQAQVQSLMPSAFRTVAQGRLYMQVGSYSDRTNAEKMVSELSAQGLKARIEALN